MFAWCPGAPFPVLFPTVLLLVSQLPDTAAKLRMPSRSGLPAWPMLPCHPECPPSLEDAIVHSPACVLLSRRVGWTVLWESSAAYAVKVTSCSGYLATLHRQEGSAPCPPASGLLAGGASSIRNVGQGSGGEGAWKLALNPLLSFP